MAATMIARIGLVIILFVAFLQTANIGFADDLSGLRKGQALADFRLANLYADSDGKIMGAKFRHAPTGAPIFLFQIETVPQVFMWIDAPAYSGNGLPHSLEHLLAGKGTKGRYVSLLRDMRLSQADAATSQDYNFYSLASGTGIAGFFEQFHAWLDALYLPDFTDVEAEWEFYHFGVASDPTTKKKTLIEKGAVYDEMETGQGIYTYFFELNRQVLGDANPFAFYSSGVPDEMQLVTPQEIRRYHKDHYRLGPTTGFIFALDPKENVSNFLKRISQAFHEFANDDLEAKEAAKDPADPKYPIHPSGNTTIKICPFPSRSEADRGEVRFAWKAVKTDSQTDLKMLQLLFRGLGDGEKSLLYKTLVNSKTRELDSGATNVESQVFLDNSPHFPIEFVGLSGIPGNRISLENVEQLRQHIMRKLADVLRYPDGSAELASFNKIVKSYAEAWRRSEKVWIKSAPLFGSNEKTDWKEFLNYLEIDSSFVRSLTEETVWPSIERQLDSGINVWRDLIQHFNLLETPYATASVPSPQLLDGLEEERQKRIDKKIKQLMGQYKANDEQEALSKFEGDEASKSKQIEKIAAGVLRPRFTDHPPLTADDDIRYRQFRLDSVPVIATFFNQSPTIDIGLSFDLTKIPVKYYKYLPIIPRCLDSLGLRSRDQVISYTDLLGEIQRELYEFSVRYDENPVSHRADLTIRASAASPNEFRIALGMVQRMIRFNDLDISNVDRLRDLVDKRLWQDETYTSDNESMWFMNPSYTFRYQKDALYVALFSVLTRAHWDGRLKWLLHVPVDPKEIDDLGRFAEKTLASMPASGKELSEELSRSTAKGLEGELLAYWERNITAFPEAELGKGLRLLTREVQDDLRVGPEQTITDIKELQRLIFDHGALKIDLTLDPGALDALRPTLIGFINSIPTHMSVRPPDSRRRSEKMPLLAHAEKRNGIFGDDFPLFVAFDDHGVTGSMVFFADFFGYDRTDRESLLRVLSTKLVSGTGLHTSFMKSREDGLAYDSLITSDPSLKLLWYYGERSSDIPSLVKLVNSVAESIPTLRDESLIDYALQQTFTVPRALSTFSERGRGLAQDIRDGNEPEKVRRFSQSILRLRNDPDLLSELTRRGVNSISPLLIRNEFRPQQHKAKSLFFFVGPDRILSDIETRLPVPHLLRLYPSDFWLDFSGNSDE